MWKKSGVMGLNAREQYIKKYNNAHSFRLANDKIYAREILQQSDIPVPKILGLITLRQEIQTFDFDALPKDFVIKPAQGSRGRGILVLKRYKKGIYQKPNRSFVTIQDLKTHCSKILDGQYSLIANDTVLIEEKLTIDPIFNDIGFVGLPDIRIIVVNLVPLMAMLRIPTEKSEGKANIHAGAFGIGIDIKTGQLFHGVSENKVLTLSSAMRNFEIPGWNRILEIAVKSQEVSEIGYLGVDITLDKDKGPMVLELNAQPGLEIQNANQAPLRSRIARIEHFKVKNVKEGVHLGQELFGQKSADLQYITGDHIIGRTEEVHVMSKLGTMRSVIAKISPDTTHTKIELELAKRLGYITEKGTFQCKFYLKGNAINSKAEYFQKEKDSNTKHLMIIGRRDLEGFLVDPRISFKEISKKQLIQREEKKKEPMNMDKVDTVICDISKMIKIIPLLRPENLEKEKEVFFASKTYNPHFRYKKPKYNTDELRSLLLDLPFDNSAIGTILKKKQEKLLLKLDFVDAIGTEHFKEKSEALFGSIDTYDIEILKKEAGEYRYDREEQGKKLSTQEIVKRIENMLKKYNLMDWKVIVKEDMITNFSAGKSGTIFIKSGFELSEKMLQSTLAHEIETHVFTAVNGQSQPYEIFTQGWGNYLTTQEGLAIYNQVKVEKSLEKYQRMARDLELLHNACHGSFRDVYEHAMKYTSDPNKAWQIALRMKRGVARTEEPQAYTKRIIYYEGYHLVEDYLKKGDIKKLYIGKIALEDIDLLDSIEELHTDILLPDFWK